MKEEEQAQVPALRDSPWSCPWYIPATLSISCLLLSLPMVSEAAFLHLLHIGHKGLQPAELQVGEAVELREEGHGLVLLCD